MILRHSLMKKALFKKIVILMSAVALSITWIVVLMADSNGDQQWKKYYDGDRSTFFYDKESIHYPYKDNNKIIAVSTKNIPSTYLTHNQERIGYFLDLIYIDCGKSRYRRKEMSIYSDSGELIKRQMGLPTYYTIDPGSEPEALLQKLCR
jgi:hypothetical protein